MHRNPDSVIIDDAEYSEGTGTNTPANEPSDDFFSSWDKPAIKRPSNPPSRTGTPAARTASPFLNANGNGVAARPKSPLVNADSTTPDPAAPPANRTVSSATLRKTATTVGGNKSKANILGAKKTKLGAKKLDSSALDFDAAEKKAKEEAERKERLGYDPDEEAPPVEAQMASAQPSSNSATIHAPTPVSPGRAGNFGAVNAPRERSDAEMERLGMGVRKLGFGQIGGAAGKAAPKSGFGATSRAPVQGELSGAGVAHRSMRLTSTLDESQTFAREKFGLQKGISSDEFFGRGNFDPNSQAEAKTRLQGFEGASAISSNAYFGRPEDEEEASGDYGDLETAAKDFVRRFGITAGDDLENLSSMLGEGAQKLQGAIRNYLNG